MPLSVDGIRTCVETARRRGSDHAAADATAAIDQWFDAADEWAVGRDTARFLARLVEGLRPSSVLEFGTGRSTAVIAHAMAANGGGRLTTVDHIPHALPANGDGPLTTVDGIAHASSSNGDGPLATVDHRLGPAAPWLDRACGMPGIDLETIASPLGVRLTTSGAMFTYVSAADPIARRGPYDLVFVDAPPSAWGRDCALPLAYEALADPAVIVVDDTARAAERACVRRWLATTQSLEIVLDDASFDRGLTVLVHTGPARRRLSLTAIAGSSWHLLRGWPSRRRVRRAYPLLDVGAASRRT